MPHPRPWTSYLALLLLPLLGLLAFLQVRWIDEAVRFEQRRMQGALASSALAFRGALKADVGALDTALSPGEDWRRADFREPLRALRAHPRLGALPLAFFMVEDGQTWRLGETAGRFTPEPNAPEPMASAVGIPGSGLVMGSLDGRAVIYRVLPVVDTTCAPGGSVAVRRVLRPPALWTALDRGAFASELVPELLRQAFGGLQEDFAMRLLGPSGEALGTLGAVPRGGEPDLTDPIPIPSPLASALPGGAAAILTPEVTGESPWRLQVTHRSGSSATVLTRLRSRNLALALGILGILAAGLAVLVDAVRRARNLALRERQFVASISHELKTPLAVLLSAGENLAAGIVTDPAHVQRYGRTIHGEGMRLREMIDKIMGFSRLEGRPRGTGEPFDPDAVVAGVIARISPLASNAGVTIRHTTSRPGARVLGRMADLEAILENLLGNALKHGAPLQADRNWTITVVTERKDGRWLCRVQDPGPGIPWRERWRIFAPFRRGSRAEDRQVPGSGLGLAIARECARTLGGDVRLAAQRSQGARFTVSLPEQP